MTRVQNQTKCIFLLRIKKKFLNYRDPTSCDKVWIIKVCVLILSNFLRILRRVNSFASPMASSSFMSESSFLSRYRSSEYKKVLFSSISSNDKGIIPYFQCAQYIFTYIEFRGRPSSFVFISNPVLTAASTLLWNVP